MQERARFHAKHPQQLFTEDQKEFNEPGCNVTVVTIVPGIGKYKISQKLQNGDHSGNGVLISHPFFHCGINYFIFISC